MNSTVARLDELTKNLNEGKGTAGQLLHDTKLYDTMNSAANEIKEPHRGHPQGPEEVPQRPGQHFLGAYMARDDGGAAGTVVVAFVLGAITGAAVALLMAPASGEETRRMLAEKAREGREKAGEAAQKGRELWDRQRETLTTAFERGKEAYEQARGAQPPGKAPGEAL